MYYIIIIVLAAIDQAIKYAIRTNMDLKETIPVVENVFHITYIQNPGASFGVLQGQTALLIVVPVILIVAIIVYLYAKTKGSHFTLPLSLALICAGGFGNLIDRIRFGAVVDFIDFRVFPIFNAADIFVCTGSGLLILYMLFFDKPKGDSDGESAENAENAESAVL